MHILFFLHIPNNNIITDKNETLNNTTTIPTIKTMLTIFRRKCQLTIIYKSERQKLIFFPESVNILSQCLNLNQLLDPKISQCKIKKKIRISIFFS